MNLMTEISCVFDLHLPKPKVKCEAFEDNRSTIKMSESAKFSPRTKHIALKCHHFRRFVQDGIIELIPIDTQEQTANIFTKPLDEKLFNHLRNELCGWSSLRREGV